MKDLKIGYNNISIATSRSRRTSANETSITLFEQLPLTRQELNTALKAHPANRDDRQSLLSFDFLVQATMAEPAEQYLNYLTPASGLRFDQDRESLTIFSRYGNRVGSIKVRDQTLSITIHYHRNDPHLGFSHSLSVKELESEQVWNLCLNKVFDLLETIIVTVVPSIEMENVTSLSDLIKLFAIENLKSQQRREALRYDIEMKYRKGIIRGGNITRLRRFLNSMIEDGKLSEFQQLRQSLRELLPTLMPAVDGENENQRRPIGLRDKPETAPVIPEPRPASQMIHFA